MELIAKHPPLRNFTIPRKIFGPLENPPRSSPKLFSIPIESEVFKKSFAPIFMSHISSGCNMKEQIKILDCIGITNEYLEQKFDVFRKRLEEFSLPSEVTYGFMVLSNISQQAEIISERGMRVGNFTLGEVGDAEKGVYLVENPDLVVPSVFFEPTTIRIMCFKVIKGRCRTVDLGSHKLEPSFGYNSHVPPAVKNRKLSRYIMHRFSQIYLFESYSSGKYSKIPANVLPFAIFTVEFFPLASAKFNLKMVNVWNGSLKSGPQVYHGISLSSVGGILLKPLSLSRHLSCRLSELQIPALVDWTSCLKFPFIQELLTPSLIGDLNAKKELYLNIAKQYVSYYILSAADMSEDFVKFVEIAQVHRVVGYQILDSDAHILLIPNGSLSMALCLPYRSDPIFHCLHLSKESCISGLYKPLDEKESAALNRDPLISEKIDGLNKQMEKVVSKLSSESQVEQVDRNAIPEVPQSAKYNDEACNLESASLTKEKMDVVDTNEKDCATSGLDAMKIERIITHQFTAQKNTIRKTKVITSSSLMDPRLTVSEYFKKRQAQGKVKDITGLSEIDKVEDNSHVIQFEASQQYAKQNTSEPISPSCSSYAYKAPVPQVALVIEKMKDSESSCLSSVAEKTKSVDQSCQKTTVDEEVLEEALKINCARNFSSGLSIDIESYNTLRPVDKKAHGIMIGDDTRDGSENSNDESSDVDLRIMCLSELRLAEIMSSLRSRCQNVEDSEVQHLLNHPEQQSANSISSSKIVNAFQYVAFNRTKFTSVKQTKPSRKREAGENFCRTVENDFKDNFDPAVPFDSCLKKSCEVDDERDMDYRLNSNVTALLKSVKGGYVSCSAPTSFNSTLLPV